MTDDPNLDPLPDDVRDALLIERARPDLPADETASIVARIEGTKEFAAATDSRQVGPSRGALGELTRGLRTPVGIGLFLAGALWGAALGATVVLLLTRFR